MDLASLGRLFQPQAPSPEGANPGEDTYTQGMDPRTMAAVLSMAGAASQPLGFGQTGFGHLMSAMGAGGDAVRNQELLDIKAGEADSKSELRAAQAENAVARAGTAGANAENARMRLGLTEQEMNNKNMRNSFNNRIRFVTTYQTYLRDLRKKNENIALGFGKPGEKAVPEPSPDEYMQMFPDVAAKFGMTPQEAMAAMTGGPISGPSDETGGGQPTSGAGQPQQPQQQATKYIRQGGRRYGVFADGSRKQVDESGAVIE